MVRARTASASSPTCSRSTSRPSSRSCRAQFAPPTVKQHLAALRMLFDWLVTGHVLDVNPAHAVRGPKYVVKKGKTPVLTAEEARELLDSIDHQNTAGERRTRSTWRVARSRADRRHGLHLRPHQRRARNEGARLFHPGRRGWVRLHEKGGKEHEVPCHHNLEKLSGRVHRRRRHRRRSGRPAVPHHRPQDRPGAGRMWQQDAYRMIQRRAAARRHQDQDREPHLPRDGHHRLPEEQRQAGSTRRPSPTTPRRARRSCMTGGQRRFRSMRWRRSQSNHAVPAPGAREPRQGTRNGVMDSGSGSEAERETTETGPGAG